MISWYQEISSWYQEFDILISRIRFLDIKKSISWYQELPLLNYTKPFLDIKNSNSWYQEFDFLISRIWFLDIKKWILDIKKWILDIKKWILEIKKWILDIKKYLLISRNRIIDIKKSNSWYQEFGFDFERKTIARNIWISSTKVLHKCLIYFQHKSCAELIFIVDFQRTSNAEIHSDFGLKTCARLYCDSISNAKLVQDYIVIRFRTQNLCTN